jgi:replicative DNA helicase
MQDQAEKTLNAIKIPPQSREAEQSVLGSIMLDEAAWDKVADKLSEEDFYFPEHKIIFRSMLDLVSRERPHDVVTISEVLKDNSQLEKARGEVYLFELVNNTPSVANVAAYADIIRERSVYRQLIKAAGEIADSAYNPGASACVELLDQAEQKVFAIAEQGATSKGPENIKTLLAKAVDRIDTLFHADSPITGLSTGFTDLDNMTSGLQPADLVIVAGRPSMGKTAFSMNLAENAAIKSDKPVLIFSMEMPGDSLALRMLSSLGHIDQHRIRTGKLHDEDWPRITSAVNMLSSAPLFIDDTPALSPAEVRARARRLVKEHGPLSLIVIDYLQLMQIPGSNENRTLEVSEISRNLKTLAKELNIPVIALSQLNRSLEQRADKRPVMSDLRESGSIEQDADIIAFIYRDEVYNEESPDKGTAEIIIAKQRNGPIGRVRLSFQGQYTRFENFTSTDYDQDF